MCLKNHVYNTLLVEKEIIMVHILYTIIVINLNIGLSNFSELISTAITLPVSFAPPEEMNSYTCNKGDNSTRKALKKKTTIKYFQVVQFVSRQK